MADIANLMVDQFYRTTLTASVDLGATEIVVSNSGGFPEPTGGKYFYLTLVSGDVAEVVTVTQNNVGTNTLTISPLQAGFLRDSRAEHWFTAQAFKDIQIFLKTLTDDGTVYPGVDNDTIEANTLLMVKTINGSHIFKAAEGVDEALKIERDSLKASSVGTYQIAYNAVTNLKVDASGIDAVKIKNFTGTLPVDAIPDLRFGKILYVDGTFTEGGSPPSGGVEGDLVMEFETTIPPIP